MLLTNTITFLLCPLCIVCLVITDTFSLSSLHYHGRCRLLRRSIKRKLHSLINSHVHLAVKNQYFSLSLSLSLCYHKISLYFFMFIYMYECICMHVLYQFLCVKHRVIVIDLRIGIIC